MSKYNELVKEIAELNQKYDLCHYGYGLLLLVDALEKLEIESNIDEITDDVFDEVLFSVQNVPIDCDTFIENVYEIIVDAIPNLEAIVNKEIEIE